MQTDIITYRLNWLWGRFRENYKNFIIRNLNTIGVVGPNSSIHIRYLDFLNTEKVLVFFGTPNITWAFQIPNQIPVRIVLQFFRAKCLV